MGYESISMTLNLLLLHKTFGFKNGKSSEFKHLSLMCTHAFILVFGFAVGVVINEPLLFLHWSNLSQSAHVLRPVAVWSSRSN